MGRPNVRRHVATQSSGRCVMHQQGPAGNARTFRHHGRPGYHAHRFTTQGYY